MQASPAATVSVFALQGDDLAAFVGARWQEPSSLFVPLLTLYCRSINTGLSTALSTALEEIHGCPASNKPEKLSSFLCTSHCLHPNSLPLVGIWKFVGVREIG